MIVINKENVHYSIIYTKQATFGTQDLPGTFQPPWGRWDSCPDAPALPATNVRTPTLNKIDKGKKKNAPYKHTQ